MPTFEEVLRRLASSPRAGMKCLIGGLLMFIPVLNLLALGYIWSYLKSLQASGNFELPEWADWGNLFVDGLRMLAVLLICMGLPLGIGFLLASLLKLISFGLLGILAYTCVSIACLIAPATFALGLHLAIKGKINRKQLNLPELIQKLVLSYRYMLLPTLAFWGLIFGGAPLYGLAAFIGIIAVSAYGIVVFMALERGIR